MAASLPLYEFHPQVLFYWLVAFAVWEWVFVASSLRWVQFSTFHEYYRTLPSWVPVTGDFLYSTLIFLTAQGVLAFLRPWLVAQFPQIPLLGAFVGIFIVVQWIFDLTYATLVLRLPSATSRYVDFFQRYIRQVSFKAALGDTLYGLVWLGLLWLFLRYVPLGLAVFILVAALFVWLMVKY